jgi:hypothetical protein
MFYSKFHNDFIFFVPGIVIYFVVLAWCEAYNTEKKNGCFMFAWQYRWKFYLDFIVHCAQTQLHPFPKTFSSASLLRTAENLIKIWGIS